MSEWPKDIENLRKKVGRHYGPAIDKKFLRQLKMCFDMAYEMCGSHHPNEIVQDQKKVEFTYKWILEFIDEHWGTR